MHITVHTSYLKGKKHLPNIILANDYYPYGYSKFAAPLFLRRIQFIIDELVEEIEEAFVAAAEVLNKLPYPIR